MSMKHGRIRGQQLHLTGEGKESRPAYNAGQLYPVDPVAVERLKAIMAQQVKKTVVPKEQKQMSKVAVSTTDAAFDAAMPALKAANGMILNIETDVQPPDAISRKGASKYDPVMDVILASKEGAWIRMQLDGKGTATLACTHFKKKEFRQYLAMTGRLIEAKARRSPDQPDTTSWLYARWVQLEANSELP